MVQVSVRFVGRTAWAAAPEQPPAMAEAMAGHGRQSFPCPPTAAGENFLLWLDLESAGTSLASSPYQRLERTSPVIVQAKSAEPGVLERFAGIMTEVFPGAPLSTEDVDKAIRQVRRRD